MITEKNFDGLIVRTETHLIFGDVRITQKQIEDDEVKKVSVLYLDRVDMNAIIEEYQSKETQMYLNELEKTNRLKELSKYAEEKTSLEGVKSFLKSSL